MRGDAGCDCGMGGVYGDGVSCSVGVGVFKNHLGETEANGVRGGYRCAYQAARLRTISTRLVVRVHLGTNAYLVCLIINAIFSVVTSSAAMMRSPSFSRSCESSTTMNSPLPRNWDTLSAVIQRALREATLRIRRRAEPEMH